LGDKKGDKWGRNFSEKITYSGGGRDEPTTSAEKQNKKEYVQK